MTASMPVVEERLGCEGYYGFGGGWAMARGFKAPPEQTNGGPDPAPGPGQPIYCNTMCERSDTCWELHRKRVRRVLPALAIHFEQFAREHEQSDDERHVMAAWAEYLEEHDMGGPGQFIEPYTTVMAGNLEDGARVGSGEDPKERGKLGTLSYPLDPIGEKLETLEADLSDAERQVVRMWEAEVDE